MPGATLTLGQALPSPPKSGPRTSPPASHSGYYDFPLALDEHITDDRWGGPHWPWLCASRESWPGLLISVTGGNEIGSQLFSSEPAIQLPDAQLPASKELIAQALVPSP